MALSVAFPPMPALPSDPTMNTFLEPSGGFPTISCGFEPFHCAIKTEPQTPQDPGPPPSFFHPPYTSLSSANFSHLKHGHTDLYAASSEDEELSSWTYKHPEHWEAKEVLDWVYSLTEDENVDGALFRGEAYNTLTGRQLRDMSVADFLALDQQYGARVHDVFNFLLEDADFKQPLPPETFQSEYFHGNLPRFDFLQGPDDAKPSQQPPPPPAAPSMSVYVDKQGREMTVSLDGLGLYDIDVDFTSITSKDTLHRSMDDSDYHSGSEGGPEVRPRSASSEVFEPLFSDKEDGEGEEERLVDMVVASDSGRKPHTCSPSSCDSGCEGEEEKTSPRKRQSSSSKGNHLWEFIRDLLKNPAFNPSLVRWEDKDQGVFKFVQSEAVAQLWGRKKNNPQMTYEKLSRAMRFCRSAGYFESVPKTGRFPKKLCFKFGRKAHDWQD